MRRNVIVALCEKPVEFLLFDEILTATDEELEEALKRVQGLPRTKQRVESIQRELGLRKDTKENCPYNTEWARQKFVDEWNRVIKMFK